MAAKSKKASRARGKGKSAPTIEQRVKLLTTQHGELLKVQRETIEQVAAALERIGAIELKERAIADARQRDLERALEAHAFALRARKEGHGICFEVDESAPRLPWWKRLFNGFARGAAQAG